MAMGLFRGYCESLMAVLLCSLMCNELVCNATNSWPLNGERRDSFSESTISIKMPGTRPLERDTYLCTAVQLSSQKQYIVDFEPSASQKTAHHMLLFGCNLPGSGSPSWDCKSGPYDECRGSQEILYAWAKDAPPKYLPKDVGFAVGGDSGIKYLVLQVHYASVDPFQDGTKDYSGFTLHTRQHSLPYLGGIYLLWAYSGAIQPETSGVHVDIACKYERSEPMFAFAFRPHAHSLATVITGYRIRDGVWTLLGKGDPQAPQAFYPMEKTYEIKTGDILAARCTYDSRGHNIHGTVHMGSSGHDEMCNFYIMYYSNAERVEYSGGNCGEQNHPEIFRDFPADSDIRLVHSPGLKPTSHRLVHTSTADILSTTKVTPGKMGKTDVPKSKDGGDKVALPSSSSSSGRHTSVVDSSISTRARSQGISHLKVSPTKSASKEKVTDSLQTKSQPVIPAESSVIMAAKPAKPVTQARAKQQHYAELHVVTDWPSLMALEKTKLGQVTGVSLDSKGQVIVFHRGSRIWDDSTFDSSNVFRNADIVGTIPEHTVWIIDSATGKVKGFWGKNLFYLPHGLTIDHEDNLWLTDVGSHQVFKFSPLSDRTQRILALGDKLVPGSDNSRFCKPTSVAVDKNGDFFVADGYCNSRILKFSAAGKLLSTWGKPSYAGAVVPAPGSFFIPHSLALDSTRHTLYVADRENGRVQAFSSISGTFVDEIKLPEFGGLVYAVDYSDTKQGGVLHVVNGPNRQNRDLPVQGFTIRAADKTLLEKWPSEKGQVLSQPHDLVSSVDGTDVYVVEIGPNRVLKLSSKQRPTTTTPTHTVPVVTSKHLITQEGSGFNPKQGGNENKTPSKTSNVGLGIVHLVEEKASVIPTVHRESLGTGDEKGEKSNVNPKESANPVEADVSSLRDGGTSSVNPSDNQESSEQGTDEHSSHLDEKESKHRGISRIDDLSPKEPIRNSTDTHKVPVESHSSETASQGSVMWVNVTENAFNPEPTASGVAKNRSLSGARNDAEDSDDSDNITAGVIPALVILSVLAVPIVFLLLISITLRVRAYRRDRQRQMNGLHGNRKDFSVGTTRGWWSYMNCCDRQKYKFNRVTLQDFYSDSDSDGV